MVQPVSNTSAKPVAATESIAAGFASCTIVVIEIPTDRFKWAAFHSSRCTFWDPESFMGSAAPRRPSGSALLRILLWWLQTTGRLIMLHGNQHRVPVAMIKRGPVVCGGNGWILSG